MNYQFAVTGIGICVDGMTDHEDLIEAVTAQKKITKQKFKPTIPHAVKAALKYKDEKTVIMISHAEVPDDILGEFHFAECKTRPTFAGMLEESVKIFSEGCYENALLLAQSEEGYAAVLLSAKPARSMAQAEIRTETGSALGESLSPMDAMLQFIKATVEIRFAFKLDGGAQEGGTYIWHWMEKRELTRSIDGIEVHLKEAALVNRAVFESSRYLFPVTFTTAAEAEKNLLSLREDVAKEGLYAAMKIRTDSLKAKKRGENTIVLLAENVESLNAQIDELLQKKDQLLTEGFTWKNLTGSLYIRSSTKTPKVVFMNPPGGMFHSKPFHRYVSKLYDFVEDTFKPSRNVFSNRSGNEMLHRYLDEVNITFVVMYLLETIGIHPDYLSGASMGEVVFDLSNSAIRDGDSESTDIDCAMDSLESTIRNVIENKKEHEKKYFGREINLTKYYLKCNAEDVKKALTKYDDVFVIIEGSPKDVLICGDKHSSEKLIKELGCIAMEMDDPMYIHTPVLKGEFEHIRTNIVNAGVYLDVDELPYQLFSTYLKKNMDSSTKMFAENFAAIITQSVNYTEAIRALYDRGARVLIDLSTTQLCGNWAKETLSAHSDVKVISIYEDKDTASYLLDLCAAMLAGNVDFDFEKIYSRLTFVNDEPKIKESKTSVMSIPKIVADNSKTQPKKEVKTMVSEKTLQKNITASKPADTQQMMNQYIANQMAINHKAYEMYLDAENKLFEQFMTAYTAPKPTADSAAAVKAAAPTMPAPKKDYLWDREQIIEMTDRSMAAVLGDQYKEVDQYPIRARMPLPPFLFVSRIISIDAEFGKLRPSSIVAEYDLDETCVFRTGDKQISPLIGSEASHIAIFLIAYMGLDAMSKGTLSYRAIDSSQVSYSERPFRVGDTMRTVLKINRFVQNGSTILLFFTFETYNGEELIAVTEATGGFFTKAELSSNKGIISPKKLLKKVEPKEFLHFNDSTVTSYNEQQVSAFYNGNYEECFGVHKKPSLKETYYVHDMKMIDRITKIDYNGGMYGRGIICGEKQITPDMWPFKAHFKNDPVFPAIIMTDGVTQLGVFLFAHAGLLSKFESSNVTMINGNCVKSKFRGQARHGYSTLRYEVHVKDVIQTEDCISVYFDAGIFNDGLQIIQVESYALKIFSDPN
ncbi:MAG: hypothetical protein IJA86_07670 [Clostridia bacterium]|nr:hypothetical protein [Clostridia bacterium]